MLAALIHASRAAVDPVTHYYNRHGIETVNLLDDGVMRLLARHEMPRAVARLAELIETARTAYGADLALVTCSAVTCPGMAELRARAEIPVLKIDEPMAEAAVRVGRRIGVVATFPATAETTAELLRQASGGEAEVETVLAPEALEALLAGDQETHDRLFLDAVDRCGAQLVDAVVLAQVSMARLHDAAAARVRQPVFSSLASSLEAVRRSMAR